MDVQPLACDRLPKLPKLDKKQFITSYLQGQIAHATSHAEEGRALASSWDVSLVPEELLAGSFGAPPKVGFATPVLKARTPRTVNDEGSVKDLVPFKPSNKLAGVDKTQPKLKPKPKLNPVKIQKQDCVSGKRGADSDSDDSDQAARLRERRERKRIKRAIVQPKQVSEPNTASSHGKDNSKRRAKAKGRKVKAPSGFVLMHGFSAANVGSNRLTLKPPSNVGVFKKGKASFKTKVKRKLKGNQAKPFSESGFLNATRKPLPCAGSKSTSSTSGDESPAEGIVEHPEKKSQAQPARQVKSLRVLSESSLLESETSKPAASQKRLHAESEIWDIESRASEKRKLKMQKTCSTDEAGASCIQGTVVVDARIPAWCPQPDIASRNLAVEVTHDVPDAVAIPSSPSLRPSQSASQIGLLVVKTVHPDEASRYFPVLNPINDPVKYTSSLGRAPEPIEDGTDTGRPFLGDPAKTLDLESPLPSIRFMVPTRNRAFAQHFLPVHHSQPPATYFHAPDAVFPEPEDSRYPEEHYDCAPVSFFGATTEHDQNDIGHEYTASGLGHYGEPQHGQSSAGWDPYTIYPEFGTLADASGEEGDEYTDQYDMYDNGTDDEELNNDLMFQQDFTELDWTGDGNLIELVDEWHVDAHPQFDQYGCYETASFIFGSGDTALTADVEGEVENSTNSMHCADWVDSFDDGEELSVWDDAEAFMETARNDQGTIESSYSVRYNSRGVVSDCGDAGAYHPRFNEGRALLLGLPLPEPSDRASSPRPHLSHAEMNVVKDMGGHWLPQKL